MARFIEVFRVSEDDGDEQYQEIFCVDSIETITACGEDTKRMSWINRDILVNASYAFLKSALLDPEAFVSVPSTFPDSDNIHSL